MTTSRNLPGHTPGPWLYAPAGRTMSDNYNQSFAVCEDARPNLIAGCFRDVRGGGDTAHANARLIAAAPDLLEALKWAEAALAPFSKDPAEKSGIAKIRAAIVKAESHS